MDTSLLQPLVLQKFYDLYVTQQSVQGVDTLLKFAKRAKEVVPEWKQVIQEMFNTNQFNELVETDKILRENVEDDKTSDKIVKRFNALPKNERYRRLAFWMCTYITKLRDEQVQRLQADDRKLLRENGEFFVVMSAIPQDKSRYVLTRMNISSKTIDTAVEEVYIYGGPQRDLEFYLKLIADKFTCIGCGIASKTMCNLCNVPICSNACLKKHRH